MQLGILIPIAALTVGPISWAFVNWTRTRHGYPVEGDNGELISRDGALPDARQIELLSTENQRLTGTISRLEQRIAVLERIATDPGARLASEIESLRALPQGEAAQ